MERILLATTSKGRQTLLTSENMHASLAYEKSTDYIRVSDFCPCCATLALTFFNCNESAVRRKYSQWIFKGPRKNYVKFLGLWQPLARRFFLTFWLLLIPLNACMVFQTAPGKLLVGADRWLREPNKRFIGITCFQTVHNFISNRGSRVSWKKVLLKKTGSYALEEGGASEEKGRVWRRKRDRLVAELDKY